MKLQFLPSYKIDESKWNECIKGSINPLLYATSTYLNAMADNWGGIVVDDYAAIMPVTWRQKFGIKYCYNAAFTQQLGVYTKSAEENYVDDCYALMRQNFKYGDYSFNYKNHLSNHDSTHNNFIISLASNYRSTSFFYTDKLKADLTKAANNSLDYNKGDAEEAINLYRGLYGSRFEHITERDYKNFHDVCKLLEKENNLIVRKISSGQKIFAINLLLKDKFRIYNLMSCTTTEGRSKLAGHLLYDAIIKEFSQTGLVFDFEGSDMDGVAHFYKSFGAINQPYTKVHFNQLPKLLRLLKR